MCSAPICRLRPDPGATQIALSVEAGLTYYESFGQNWERAALIKARVVAGDVEAGEEFLRQLSPFVWRKYLDFAAVADIHAMKRRVHAFKGHGAIAVEGHDIKLGRGGIRDIEFFAQTQQLITGGRHPELQNKRDDRNPQSPRGRGMDRAGSRQGADRGLSCFFAASRTGCKWSATSRPTSFPPSRRSSIASPDFPGFADANDVRQRADRPIQARRSPL